MAKYDAQGREIPDPRVVPAPFQAGYVSIHDQIKAAIKVEMSRMAEADGNESFEEADDFDVEDDADLDFAGAYDVEDAPAEVVEGVRDEDPDPPVPPQRKRKKVPEKPQSEVEDPPPEPEADATP